MLMCKAISEKCIYDSLLSAMNCIFVKCQKTFCTLLQLDPYLYLCVYLNMHLCASGHNEVPRDLCIQSYIKLQFLGCTHCKHCHIASMATITILAISQILQPLQYLQYCTSANFALIQVCLLLHLLQKK